MGATVDTDLCILGAGAAGITVALEFVNSKHAVVLLEGGGETRSQTSQELYAGTCDEPIVDNYLRFSRLRFLGGTTNHWLGACPALDPVDFEYRDWLPDSGWPFSRGDIQEHYLRAADILSIPAPGLVDNDPPLTAGSQVAVNQFPVRAIRFGQEYRNDLASAPNLQAVINANAIHLGLEPSGRTVERVDVATAEDKRFSVRASQFVLALGGIENSRMLLTSRDVQTLGVGNDWDVVGRYFMDHMGFPFGRICVSDRDQQLVQVANGFGRVFRLSTEYQHRKRLYNCALRLGTIPETEDTRHFLLTEGAWGRLAPYIKEAGLKPSRSLLARDLKETNDNRPLFLGQFELVSEQPPTANSRIVLGNEKDRFGNLKVHLRWSPSQEIHRTARMTAKIFAHEVGRAGLGRVAVDFELLEKAIGQGTVYQPGFHHMGGTRMNENPRKGVVNSQCRVHGVDNLYVAGSSVFPTSGWANPTFTIVALAIRLSDHLATRFEKAL